MALACGERLLVAAVWGAWAGGLFLGLRAPRFFWCARLLRAGVFLWRAVWLLFSWVKGAWRGCSFPVFGVFAHPREGACLSFCIVWSVRFYCGWFSCWRSG